MILTFVGGSLRIRAKRNNSLTVCASVYAAPLFLTPLIALSTNQISRGLFPTVHSAPGLFLGALLFVSGASWLTVASGRALNTLAPGIATGQAQGRRTYG